MNRILAATLVALLGASSLDAIAQERGEARQRGGAQVERQDRFEPRGRVDAARNDNAKRDDRGQRGTYPQTSNQRYSRNESHRSGSGRGNSGSYGNSQRSGQGNSRDYSNAYGYTDYRQGLPRNDSRRDYRHDSRGDRHDYRHDRRDDRRDYRGGHRYSDHSKGWRSSGWRSSWNHGWSGTRYRAPARYYYPRGYASRSWSIGYRMPLVFLSSSYYVDYGRYGLTPPPYGCRWLRVDGDLMLVETISGEIVDIIYGFYY